MASTASGRSAEPPPEITDPLAPYRPTDLDVMAGMLLGSDETAPPLPRPTRTPLDTALGGAVLNALRRPPCGVSFSGGLDSSIVLAVATDIARREGLPLPVPVTLRWPAIPESDETHWQELVVDHLDLADWVRLDFEAELDVLGPEAAAVIGQHGLLTPPNLYLHAPVLRQVRGGSLLTGVGGDEVFASGSALRILADRPPMRSWPRSAARLAVQLGPSFLRYHLLDTRPFRYPWLRPDAREQVRLGLAAEAYGGPARWDRSAHDWWRSRQVQSDRRSMATLGVNEDVVVHHPIIDPNFLIASATAGGMVGFRSRLDAVRDHFGHLLPSDLLERKDKAVFTRALFSDHTREFLRSWDGSGVDEKAVDLAALRRAWDADTPDGRLTLLAQRTWAVTQGLLNR